MWKLFILLKDVFISQGQNHQLTSVLRRNTSFRQEISWKYHIKAQVCLKIDNKV